MLCAVMAGCASAPPKPSVEPSASAPSKPTEEEVPEDRNFASGAVTVTARNEEGEIAWVLRAKNSSVHVESGSEIDAVATGVTGELFEKGKIASRYQSDKGEANDVKRTLQLDGRVKITSEAQKVVLTADRVEWMEDRQMISARGSVWVKSADYEMGPLPELWATPDLKRVGSPDRFKK